VLTFCIMLDPTRTNESVWANRYFNSTFRRARHLAVKARQSVSMRQNLVDDPPMRIRILTLLTVFVLPSIAAAQFETSPPIQFYGGFSYLSNTMNGLPGHHQPLLGWDAGLITPWFHRLRFVVDVSGYSGNNLAAQQHAVFIMAGGQYERRFGREEIFVKGLFGDARVQQHWGPNGTLGGNASFTTYLGGGLDTALTRQFGFRVEGGFQHSYFGLLQSSTDAIPYRIPGLPDYFGRISAGMTWNPRLGPPYGKCTSGANQAGREGPKSELVYETLNSFGHLRIFGNTYWSYLHVAGVEYDRNTWSKFIGARMDYVGEILPVVVLKQPANTDVFGDKLGNTFETVGGLGISPVGLRMMWRDGKRWKPYFEAKGGMIAFTKKAPGVDSTYQNFSLQQSVGVQFQLSQRWDLRTGLGDFHFSNGYMVPSDPGLDVMNFSAGLSYYLGTRKTNN
jgi:hypothetical protein